MGRKRSENGGMTQQQRVYLYAKDKRKPILARQIQKDMGLPFHTAQDTVRAMCQKGVMERVEIEVTETWARRGKPYDITRKTIAYKLKPRAKMPDDGRGQHPASKANMRDKAWLWGRRAPRPVAKPAIALEEFWGIRPSFAVCKPQNDAGQYAGEVASSENVEEPA